MFDRLYQSIRVFSFPFSLFSQVRISLFTDDEEQAFFQFDAKNSTKDTWFTQNRLEDTSYTDIMGSLSNYSINL